MGLEIFINLGKKSWGQFAQPNNNIAINGVFYTENNG
jgi:hypothetical protein